jgi:hypothetical protein
LIITFKLKSTVWPIRHLDPKVKIHSGSLPGFQVSQGLVRDGCGLEQGGHPHDGEVEKLGQDFEGRTSGNERKKVSNLPLNSDFITTREY